VIFVVKLILKRENAYLNLIRKVKPIALIARIKPNKRERLVDYRKMTQEEKQLPLISPDYE
jgi:hypothetical protein